MSNNNGQISPQIESPLPNNSNNNSSEPIIKIEATSTSSLLETTNNISTPPPPVSHSVPAASNNAPQLQLPTNMPNGNGFIPQLAFGNLYIQSKFLNTQSFLFFGK